LRALGMAYHSFSDNLSPAHSGFQPWWGPVDGINDFGGLENYMTFVFVHEYKEDEVVYRSKQSEVISAVNRKFKLLLNFILRD
jgi:hypothetical protein